MELVSAGHRSRWARGWFALVALAAVVFAGCGGGDPEAPAPSQVEAGSPVGGQTSPTGGEGGASPEDADGAGAGKEPEPGDGAAEPGNFEAPALERFDQIRRLIEERGESGSARIDQILRILEEAPGGPALPALAEVRERLRDGRSRGELSPSLCALPAFAGGACEEQGEREEREERRERRSE